VTKGAGAREEVLFSIITSQTIRTFIAG